jgi:CubicO group peptidase (beta-lactamase class C family)
VEIKMNYKLTLLIFVLLVTGCAQISKSSTERRIEKVEQGLLNAYGDPPWKGMDLVERMDHYNVPGVSIAVIDDFQLEWAKGYGVLEKGSDERVTADTLFQTGSIAKPIVAVATLQFVDRGVLSLDDDVNRSLVSWKIPTNRFTAEENVTLRYLLSHSAGVTVKGFRGYAQGEEVPDLQQILDGEAPANSFPIRVAAVPGTVHRYSGGGYMIVQQLLEDITAEPFPQIMQDTVLDPWEMNASTFESTLPEGLKANTARGHRSDGAVSPGGWHTYPEMGAGASMWSTPSDMAKFVIQVMHAYYGRADEVLSHNMAVEMLTPQIDVRGLGPVIGDDGDGLLHFLHPGANDGFQNYLIAYPERGQGAIIMTNGDNGEALADEIKRSVSITYGWVNDYTYLYMGIAISIVVIILGYLIVRRLRAKRNTA